MKIKIEKELFQWEKGRKVFLISENQEPAATILEFYNKNSKLGEAEVLEGNYAYIPDYLLKTATPLTILACFGEIGKTYPVKRKEFRVIPRPRPENYEEPEEPEEPENPGDINKPDKSNYVTKDFLQENYQPKGEYITKNDLDNFGGISVSNALPGQTIKITEINENGEPIAWEAIDFPKSEFDDANYLDDLETLELLFETEIISPVADNNAVYVAIDKVVYIF